MTRRKKQIQTNPLTRWLLDYADEHDISLTEMSLRCGLSAGALRSLINFPDRKPAIETCIRLSELTGKSSDEIMAMAGIDGVSVPISMHPDRVELLKLYDNLPLGRKNALLVIARTLVPGEEVAA